ncbi:MAG: hypothetical protein GF308_06910 [Candidatus Heimdallarchaeota archaeon]|nr:hypothetical protein [Candidatus Heimdallarchaeota archaeon]
MNIEIPQSSIFQIIIRRLEKQKFSIPMPLSRTHPINDLHLYREGVKRVNRIKSFGSFQLPFSYLRLLIHNFSHTKFFNGNLDPP